MYGKCLGYNCHMSVTCLGNVWDMFRTCVGLHHLSETCPTYAGYSETCLGPGDMYANCLRHMYGKCLEYFLGNVFNISWEILRHFWNNSRLCTGDVCDMFGTCPGHLLDMAQCIRGRVSSSRGRGATRYGQAALVWLGLNKAIIDLKLSN